MSADVVSVDKVWHYFLQLEQSTIDSVISQGLLPLSARPAAADRWNAIESAAPGHFENLYNEWCRPIVRSPYPGRSGVFFTPIDFRLLPGNVLQGRARVALPVHRLDPAWSVITFSDEGRRVSLPLSPASMGLVAKAWPAERVRRWFGADPNKLFLHVPQVISYQPEAVVVSRADLEL